MQTWIPPTGKDDAILFTINSEKGHLNSILSNTYGIYETTNFNITNMYMYNTYSTILDVNAKYITENQIISILVPSYYLNFYKQIKGQSRIQYSVYATIKILYTEKVQYATPRIRITWVLDFKIYNPVGSVSVDNMNAGLFKYAPVTDFSYTVKGYLPTQVLVQPTIKSVEQLHPDVVSGFTYPNDEALHTSTIMRSLDTLTVGENQNTESRLSKFIAFFKRRKEKDADMS